MSLEIRAAKIEELDAAIECAIKSFDGHERLFNNIVKNDPNFNISNIRVCVLNGQVVSVVNIFDRQMRIGNCQVRMGGIGSVGTRPEYRRNGYSSLILRDCIRYMRESGFDISILFTGIASFYAKIGWVLYPIYQFSALLPETDLSYNHELELFKTRQFDLNSDLIEVMRLYDFFNDSRTGTLTRNERFWKNHYTWKGIVDDLFLVAEDNYQVLAYIRGAYTRGSTKEAIEVQEVGYVDGGQSALDALFVEFIKRSRLEERNEVFAQIPTEFMQTFDKLGLKPRRREGYWTMIKIINHHSLLSKIVPMLEERLKKSEFADYDGSIGLMYESGSANLRISNGQIKVSRQPSRIKLTLSQEQFLKLIFGNMNVEQIAYSNNLILQDDHLRLIDVLFPAGEFVFYRNDSF